ncbi:hypothetical protein HDV05_007570, partial [Chytridiales sp. JEL 0842]
YTQNSWDSKTSRESILFKYGYRLLNLVTTSWFVVLGIITDVLFVGVLRSLIWGRVRGKLERVKGFYNYWISLSMELFLYLLFIATLLWSLDNSDVTSSFYIEQALISTMTLNGLHLIHALTGDQGSGQRADVEPADLPVIAQLGEHKGEKGGSMHRKRIQPSLSTDLRPTSIIKAPEPSYTPPSNPLNLAFSVIPQPPAPPPNTQISSISTASLTSFALVSESREVGVDACTQTGYLLPLASSSSDDDNKDSSNEVENALRSALGSLFSATSARASHTPTNTRADLEAGLEVGVEKTDGSEGVENLLRLALADVVQISSAPSGGFGGGTPTNTRTDYLDFGDEDQGMVSRQASAKTFDSEGGMEHALRLALSNVLQMEMTGVQRNNTRTDDVEFGAEESGTVSRHATSASAKTFEGGMEHALRLALSNVLQPQMTGVQRNNTRTDADFQLEDPTTPTTETVSRQHSTMTHTTSSSISSGLENALRLALVDVLQPHTSNGKHTNTQTDVEFQMEDPQTPVSRQHSTMTHSSTVSSGLEHALRLALSNVLQPHTGERHTPTNTLTDAEFTMETSTTAVSRQQSIATTKTTSAGLENALRLALSNVLSSPTDKTPRHTPTNTQTDVEFTMEGPLSPSSSPPAVTRQHSTATQNSIQSSTAGLEHALRLALSNVLSTPAQGYRHTPTNTQASPSPPWTTTPSTTTRTSPALSRRTSANVKSGEQALRLALLEVVGPAVGGGGIGRTPMNTVDEKGVDGDFEIEE